MLDGRMGRSHRLSWEIHRGPIPDGKWVLHRCNNTRCVNPDHLYLGDHKENMDDMARSKRASQRKLTTEQVLEIRASAEPQRVIAARLGTTQKTVWQIRAGHRYRYE